MNENAKKTILGLFSTAEDIRLPKEIICALIEHKYPVATTKSAMNGLLEEKKLIKTGRGSCELFMLRTTFEREKQRPKGKIFHTYPS